MSTYRGISINIEMSEDRTGFVPSIHDPAKHKRDVQMALPECAADTMQQAQDNAERWIDYLCRAEIEDAWKEANGKVGAH